jgi:hypothetical protein
MRGLLGHNWNLLGVRGVAQLGLARLPWEQEVGRSNRLAPTIYLVMSKKLQDS